MTCFGGALLEAHAGYGTSQLKVATHSNASGAGNAQKTSNDTNRTRPVQTLIYKQQCMPREPCNVCQVARAVWGRTGYEHMSNSQDALACKLNRGVTAITLQIAAESTRDMAEKDFQGIKTEIDNMEIAIKEALQERSRSARLKGKQKAEVAEHQQNALWQH